MAHVLDAVIQLRDNFSGTIKTVENNIKNFERTAKNMGRSIQNTGRGLQNFGGTLTRNITLPVAAATTAVGGMVAAFGWGRLVAMDQAKAKLQGLGYEAKEVERITSLVREAVQGTVMTVAEGTDIAAGALAAGVREGKELQRYIRLVGSAAVGANRPVADMAMIFNRVQGMGKLMTMELNMIEDGLPGFSQAMAKHLGVSLEKLREMVTDGKVTSAQFLDVMESFAGGMAEAYAKTWSGMLQNVKSNIGIIGEGLLEGVFGVSKEAIADFLNALKSDDVRQWAVETGERIKNTFSGVIETIKNVVNWFRNLDSDTQKLIGKIAIAAVAAGPVISIFGKMTTGVGKLIFGFGKFAGAVKKVGLIKTIFSPGNLVVLTLLALAAACVLVYKNWDKIKDVVAKVKTRFDDVRNTVITLKTNLIDLKDNAIETVRKKLDDFKTVLEDNQGAIKATATILGVIFGPALIKTGIQAAIAGGKIAVHFITNIIRTGTQAAINGAKLSATFVASVIRAGVQASIAGAKILIHFVGSLVKTATQAAITAAVIMGRLVFSLIVYAAQGWVTVFSVVATTFAIAAQRAVMIGATIATYALTAAQWALNFALSMNPIVWVVGLIAGLIIILITLYHKCENVRAKVDEMWNKLKTGAVNAINTVSEYWEKLKKLLSKPIVGVVKIVQKGKAAVEDKIGKNALGTHYWRGGLTWVGERGPELIELPRGTKIHPHDESIQIAGQSRGDTSTSVVITGNQFIVREESDIDKIAAAIVQKMKKAEVAYGGAW